MIDIIITNYNRETLITRAINSVFNQSYQDIHLIIVDDCSTDNSVKVIEDLLEHNTSKVECTLVKNKVNVGAGASREIGIRFLKGKYMTFLDSDDYLEPSFIEDLVKYTKKDYDIISYNCTYLEGDKRTYCNNLTEDKEFTTDKLELVKYCKFLNGSLIKSSLWDKVKYSVRRYIEDTPTYFKLVYYANKVIQTPVKGYIYTQNSPDSLCKNADYLKTRIYMLTAAMDNYYFLIGQGNYKLAQKFNSSIDTLIDALLNEVKKLPQIELIQDENNI